jgi:hypothetical protein
MDEISREVPELIFRILTASSRSTGNDMARLNIDLTAGRKRLCRAPAKELVAMGGVPADDPT